MTVAMEMEVLAAGVADMEGVVADGVDSEAEGEDTGVGGKGNQSSRSSYLELGRYGKDLQAGHNFQVFPLYVCTKMLYH